AVHVGGPGGDVGDLHGPALVSAQAFSSRGGSGRKKLTRKPTPKTNSPVTPAAKATFYGVTGPPPVHLVNSGATTPVVKNAAEVPIMRPTTLVAYAPPVQLW